MALQEKPIANVPREQMILSVSSQSREKEKEIQPPVASPNSLNPQEAPKNVQQEEKKEIKETIVSVVKKPAVDKLGPGQKYFESPEGEIITGDESKNQIWSRNTNGGKGGYVNPKR